MVKLEVELEKTCYDDELESDDNNPGEAAKNFQQAIEPQSPQGLTMPSILPYNPMFCRESALGIL